PARAILMRMLRNLHGVYVERGEWDRAARSADRLLKLAPEQDDALRDRGMAYLQLDYEAGARNDLGLYLKRNAKASDAQYVREKLVSLGGAVPRLH
ncbi:tetratricopeptide repeat protein, partial [Leclercia adecarboxylata]